VQTDLAAIPGVWSIFLVLFVVLPGGWRYGTIYGRRGRRRWGWDDRDLDGVDPQEFAALRADLESRMAEVESLNARVTELENRLDFTERLLAQHRDSSLVSTPKPELIGRGEHPPLAP